MCIIFDFIFNFNSLHRMKNPMAKYIHEKMKNKKKKMKIIIKNDDASIMTTKIVIPNAEYRTTMNRK